MTLTNDSFGEKDERGWYHIHVTEDIKQKILAELEFSKNWKQFLEANPMILKEYPEFNQIVQRLKEKIEWCKKHRNDAMGGDWDQYLDTMQATLQNILEKKKK